MRSGQTVFYIYVGNTEIERFDFIHVYCECAVVSTEGKWSLDDRPVFSLKMFPFVKLPGVLQNETVET